jgi:hypothetical protein
MTHFGFTEAQKEAIYDWLHEALSINVVFANQNIEQEAKPLAIVGVVFPRTHANMRPDKKRDGTTTNILKFHETCTLSIMIKDNKDALVYANIIERSLHTNNVKTMLKAVGLFFRYTEPIVHNSVELSDKLESTAIIDVRFGLASEITEERDIIEEVETIYEEDS